MPDRVNEAIVAAVRRAIVDELEAAGPVDGHPRRARATYRRMLSVRDLP